MQLTEHLLYSYLTKNNLIKHVKSVRSTKNYVDVENQTKYISRADAYKKYATLTGNRVYELNESLTRQVMERHLNWSMDIVNLTSGLTSTSLESLSDRPIKETYVLPSEIRNYKTLEVLGYHRTHGGSNTISNNYYLSEILNNLPKDKDGIRRTFGVEYEIYEMDSNDRSELSYLLENLPSHSVETDGSLGHGGVEVIFDPMTAEDYIYTVKSMTNFIKTRRIRMIERGESEYTRNQAAMHTTYGVSNATSTKGDIQIRLNKLALVLKGTASKSQLKNIFGRDFCYYAMLPFSDGTRNAVYTDEHSNAFSNNGRPKDCWECRLANYNASPEKMIQFFKLTEWVFNRASTKEDFINLINFINEVS